MVESVMESFQSRSEKSSKYRRRTNNNQCEEKDDDHLVFSDDIDGHEDSASILDPKKKEEVVAGVKSIALLAAATIPSNINGDRVVFTQGCLNRHGQLCLRPPA